MRLPMTAIRGLNAVATAVGRFSRWAAARPIQSTMLVATTRGLCGDSYEQRLEHKDPNMEFYQDTRRLLLYTSFSNVISAVYEWPLYVWILPRLFPSHVGGVFLWKNVAKCCALEACVFKPLVYFPACSTFKDVVVMQTHDWRGALLHCADELPDQLGDGWGYWIPLNALVLSVVPMHMRVSALSAAAVGWIGILSAVTAIQDTATSVAAQHKDILFGK